MKFALTFLLAVSITLLHGQNKKNYFPIWTFHQRNINIYGVSIGLASLGLAEKPKNTNTNGIKIELIGAGVVVPLIPRSPVAENDSVFQKIQRDTISERINGLSLSATGTVCNCITNGISIGLIGQIEHKVSGLSASIFMNFAQTHNGIQIGMYNGSYRMRGLQIGLFNESRQSKGFQIGIWNINEQRKLPIINWNFRK